MTTGYIHLGLAILCSIGIGVVFKSTRMQGSARAILISINYVTASAVAYFLAEPGTVSIFFGHAGAIVIAALTGVLFVAGFYALSFATEVAGIAMTLSVARISVVIPFTASWLFWSEDPGVAEIVGLLLAIAAFLLIARPRGSRIDNQMSALLLMAVFFLGGISDTMMKLINEHLLGAVDILSSSFMVFGTAALLSVVMTGLRRKQQIQKDEGTGPSSGRISRLKLATSGILLGLLNLGTVVFILNALQVLPGTFVFPANNVSIVVGATLLGVLFWRESTQKSTWLGIGAAIASLVLLGTGT